MSATPPATAVDWLRAGHGQHTVVALVRHGHVDNPRGLRYGQMQGFHMSAYGLGQAQALAASLVALLPHARLLRTSPLERALETMAPIERALGLQAASDRRLIEAWSSLDGQPRLALLSPACWPLFLHPQSPSWAEPFAEVAQRTLAAVRDAEAQARGGLAVLVSHQSPIWLGTLAAEREISNISTAFQRSLPPWLVRPRRCGTGTVTLLLYSQGKLVHSLAPWRPTADLPRTSQ